MLQAEYVNVNDVRKAIEILHGEGDIFEVRIIGTGKKDILSGYFKDAEKLLEAFKTVNLRQKNVYITLSQLKQECFARVQHERFLANCTTTSDLDVVGYKWLFIDLDPERSPKDISTTEEELNESKKLARKVYLYLRDLGFEEPVKALSGNGCHLLYKIAVKNDEAGRALIEKCLKVLSSMFDNEMVKVDTGNFNPSRICKLHGTLAQKGFSTADRPHRMSRIFSGGKDTKVTSRVFLEKLAAMLPEESQSEEEQRKKDRATPSAGSEFDLLDFMSRNGMTYKEDHNDRALIYKLDECPFNPAHRDGDAKIFHYKNGAIAFKCHHNSCQQYRWQDVRLKYEPDAYDYEARRQEDEARIDAGWQAHNRDKTTVPYEELKDEPLMFRTAREIYEDPEPDYEYIQSGITAIDTKMRGLQKSAVSVISGTRGSGKTTLIGQLIIQAVDKGQNVVCYSGELNNKKYLKWLIRQAAGKSHVKVNASDISVSPEDTQKIIDWFGDHFHLYNNKFGNKFDKIEKYLRIKLKEFKADLCIIDNLMALDLSEYNKDKYDAQTSFVWALKNLSELTNTHIIFVAHPKKVNGFLRLNDISGSGNIGNIVDNAFLVHRNNIDFQKGYYETFGREPRQDGITDATNIIEIAKDREFGTQDEFVSLYFEESTKRLKNTKDEYNHYGWEPDDFETVDDGMTDIPF